MRSLSLFLILLFSAWAGATSNAQVTRIPKAAEVAANIEQAYEGINDYTVTLDVTADIEQLSVQPMHATMYFKKPDKVHFESKGFLLLPREGMVYNPAAIRSRYTIEEPALRDTLNGENVYRLTLVPKTERRRSMRISAFVRPGRWTVEKVIAEPGEGRRIAGEFRYAHVDRWWLPAELTVRFSSAEADTTRGEVPEQNAPVQRPQMPRAGSITLRYSDYHMNSGLSDDIFNSSKAGE